MNRTKSLNIISVPEEGGDLLKAYFLRKEPENSSKREVDKEILLLESEKEKEKKEIQNIKEKAGGIINVEEASPITECLIHGMKIVSICLNTICNENHLLCQKCFRLESHKSHLNDVKYFEFLEDEILEESDLYEKICFLKNKIREDKKLQSTISDMIDLMMKIQSNFSSILEKNLNDLNNLEKNYSEKRVVFSDQIHSILNKQSKEKLTNIRNKIKSEKYKKYEKSQMLFDKKRFSGLFEEMNELNNNLLSCNKIYFIETSVRESSRYYEPNYPRIHCDCNGKQYSYISSLPLEQSLIKFSFQARKSHNDPKCCGVGIIDSNSSLDFSKFTGSYVNLLDNSLINMSSNKELTDEYKREWEYIYDVELDFYTNSFKVVCGEFIWKSTISLLNKSFSIFILLSERKINGFSKITII